MYRFYCEGQQNNEGRVVDALRVVRGVWWCLKGVGPIQCTWASPPLSAQQIKLRAIYLAYEGQKSPHLFKQEPPIASLPV